MSEYVKPSETKPEGRTEKREGFVPLRPQSLPDRWRAEADELDRRARATTTVKRAAAFRVEARVLRLRYHRGIQTPWDVYGEDV